MDSDIIQMNCLGSKVLVSTRKSYYFLNVYVDECVQIDSKEKQGIYGSTFYREETGKNIFLEIIDSE